MTTLTPVCGATNLPGTETVQTVRLTEIPGTPRTIYPGCALIYDVRGKTIEAAQIACSGSFVLGDGYHYRIAYRAHIFRFHHTGSLTGSVDIHFCDIASTAASSSSYGPGTVNYSAAANSYDTDVIKTFDDDEYLYIMYEAVNTQIGNEAINWQANSLPTFSVTTEEDAGTVTATPSSPSGTLSDAAVVNFRWSLSKNPSTTVINGTQIGWKKVEDPSSPFDNPEHYINVSGAQTSYVVSDGSFAAGETYVWRVRAKNGNDEWGPWSGKISFSVKSNTPVEQEGSVTATPSAPNSSVSANKVVNFRWSISKANSSTTVSKTEIQYRFAGDGSDYETMAVVPDAATSYVYEAGFSTGQTVIWRVRSANGNSAWGPWSGETSFEVKESGDGSGGSGIGISVSIATPKSGTRDGAQEIIFAWEFNGDSAVFGYEAQWTADEGITWNALCSAIGSEQSAQYTVPALTFPEGVIQWRVRAKGSSKWGNWSNASFTVAYSARGVLNIIEGPASGCVNTADSNMVSCIMSQEGSSPTPITLKSAELRWRIGTTGDWNSIAMECGSLEADCTIPANTFPAQKTIQWYIFAVDNSGNEVDSDTYSVRTLKSQIDAVPAKPVNTIELSTGEILFQWRWAAVEGTEYSKAELQFSEDSIIWSESIEAVGGSGTVREISVPAGSFDPGDIYWRVRAFDQSGSVGAWSDSAVFIAYGVENPTNIQADSRPFTLITWDAVEQIAYSVRIDGEIVYGPDFGSDGRFVLPEYLNDGEHRAEVKIQNSLELWSDWIETVFSVENNIAPEALTATGGIDAVLRWVPTGVESGDEIYVYRDGKRIAELDGSAAQYSDRIVLGTHSYEVIQRKASRYYRRYGPAVASMESRTTRIAALAGGKWIELKKTTESRGAQDYQRVKEVQWVSVLGAKYPVPEIGSFEQYSGSYQVAWRYDQIEDVQQFETLFGKAVIVKSRGNRVVVGILEDYSIRHEKFRISCSFSVKQMDDTAIFW